MPQWRKLHTKTLDSLDVNDMPDDFTRLFWVLLPLVLDSQGRILDNTNLIRSKVFPLREDVTNAMITTALEWFDARGMIVRYEVEGRRYLCATKFTEYQGDTSKETKSCYPAAPDLLQTNSGVTPDLLQSYSRPTPDLLQSNSRLDADADADVDSEESETKPPAPKTKAKPKPRPETPAAVQVFHANTGKNPARGLYQKIDSAIGRDEVSLQRWAAVIQGWLGCGWSPGNVGGMLEYFDRHEIPGTKGGKGRESPRPNDDGKYKPVPIPDSGSLWGKD
jgi:hypothetical protein